MRLEEINALKALTSPTLEDSFVLSVHLVITAQRLDSQLHLVSAMQDTSAKYLRRVPPPRSLSRAVPVLLVTTAQSVPDSLFLVLQDTPAQVPQ